MRLVVVALGIVLIFLGVGFLSAGLLIALEPSSDTDESTALVIGALFSLIGLALLAAAVGLMVQALEYALPRWVAGVVAVLGLMPYPALMGAPSLVVNVVLLGVAALLLWARQFGGRARPRGPSDTSPLE